MSSPPWVHTHIPTSTSATSTSITSEPTAPASAIANSFQLLPHELVVRIICTLLQDSDFPHRELVSVSLVNKHFNTISNDPIVWRSAFGARFDLDAIVRRNTKVLYHDPPPGHQMQQELFARQPRDMPGDASSAEEKWLEQYTKRENLIKAVQKYPVPNDIRGGPQEYEIFYMMRAIWSLCTENDGKNTAVMERAGVVDFVMTVIETLDFEDCNLELLQLSLRVLSIFCAWDPRICFRISRNENLWYNIRHLQNDFGFFPNIFDASSGLLHAAHIFFRTRLITAPRPPVQSGDFQLPPILSPQSRAFDDPSRGVQPFQDADFSGTWYGFYNYKSFLPDELAITDAFDGMMTFDLKFQPLPSDAGSTSVRFNIDGRGDDSIGVFHIRGQMSHSGQVKMMKQYTHEVRPMWMYNGVLSEVGLLGIWGDDVWGGIFWIWRDQGAPAPRHSLNSTAAAAVPAA